MHLRKQKKANGRVYLSIVQSYRTPEGKTRSKTMWSLGYLDELKHTHEDPVEYFQHVVDDLNRMREEDKNVHESLTFSPRTKIPFGAGNRLETGVAVVLRILHRDLHINKAISACTNNARQLKTLSHLTELLVWNRIAHPQIIIDAWGMRSRIPGLSGLTSDDLFNGVETLGHSAPQLREQLVDALRTHYHAAQQPYAFCFVTNYYVEETSWTNPTYNQSWHNRENPLVQLAVMTNTDGIPLDYQVFNSNLSTALSPFPAVQELGMRYPNTRLVIIADKAVGTSCAELASLPGCNYGFVLPQSLRKGFRDSREWTLDGSNYEPVGSDGSRYKERTRVIPVNAGCNNTHPESMAVREVAFWWREAFERGRFERFRLIKRNEEVFTHGVPSEGTVRPVRAIRGSGDARPEEMGDHIWRVYWDKIAADEAMDGFRDILTSELDLTGRQVVDLHKNLFMLEGFCKPAWGEWSNCPGHVPRPEYIQAHFFICFLAACVVQILYSNVREEHADEPIGATLACLIGREVMPGNYFFDFRSQLSDALANVAGVDLSHSVLTPSEINHMMQTVRKE